MKISQNAVGSCSWTRQVCRRGGDAGSHRAGGKRGGDGRCSSPNDFSRNTEIISDTFTPDPNTSGNVDVLVTASFLLTISGSGGNTDLQRVFPLQHAAQSGCVRGLCTAGRWHRARRGSRSPPRRGALSVPGNASRKFGCTNRPTRRTPQLTRRWRCAARSGADAAHNRCPPRHLWLPYVTVAALLCALCASRVRRDARANDGWRGGEQPPARRRRCRLRAPPRRPEHVACWGAGVSPGKEAIDAARDKATARCGTLPSASSAPASLPTPALRVVTRVRYRTLVIATTSFRGPYARAKKKPFYYDW